MAAFAGMSFSARVLLGMFLGVFTGLFFGEPAAALQPVADIYIRLMQMTVLPYLVTALIIGFGSLSRSEAIVLGRFGAAVLLVVWALLIVLLAVTPLTFPEFENAAFFSSALVEPRGALSLTELYFTSNPFESLSKAVIPAVVLFSSLVGISLIGLESSERMLGPLGIWNAALTRLARNLVQLTPVGVFAIAAVAAGTMTPQTFVRLEVYVIAFALLSLLLSFWILPLMVTAVTPLPLREVVAAARGSLLTAFLTGNAFIVLPMLIEQSRELLRRHGLLSEQNASAPATVIPVMFNFPLAGKLLTLLFVPFAAWFSGIRLAPGDYANLFGSGIPSYFAKAQVALPFLLDLMGLPHDLFQLYFPSTIITGKLDSLVTAMNLFVIALLAAAAVGGSLALRTTRLVRALTLIASGSALTLLAAWSLFAVAIETEYSMDRALREMHQAKRHADTLVHRPGKQVPATPAHRHGRAAAVRARGTLRIGYDPQNLPFSFYNNAGELVGFDVEIAEHLANALELRAEFVPVRWPDLPRLLDEGVIDVMPGVWYRPNWFGKLRLSEAYLVGTIGFATLDERRHEFESVEALRDSRGLRIGIPLARRQVATAIEQYLGDAAVELVTVEFWGPYFQGRYPELDAFLMPAEHASGWTLLHPEYSVVVPQPDPVRVGSGFGLAVDAGELAMLVNEWIGYAENAGIVRRAHRYWILGEGATTKQRRWSILHDVLGWKRAGQ